MENNNVLNQQQPISQYYQLPNGQWFNPVRNIYYDPATQQYYPGPQMMPQQPMKKKSAAGEIVGGICGFILLLVFIKLLATGLVMF